MIDLKVGQLLEVNLGTSTMKYNPIFMKFENRVYKHVTHDKGSILIYCGHDSIIENEDSAHWEWFFCNTHGLVITSNERIEESLEKLDLIYYD